VEEIVGNGNINCNNDKIEKKFLIGKFDEV